MSEFAKNLKKYRKMKNISQEKLGKSLNYGSTAIANYESGRNEPSLDSLIKIAEVLDVTIDDLLGMKRKTGEKQLLSAFKRLDQEKQQIVLLCIETLQF
ncbi:MAG: helix-turn-helix transcriptional regulator [Anaerotignum sp.]|nr:helix-turn-helix transcriptional regulator [Anaerotignum sp.]